MSSQFIQLPKVSGGGGGGGTTVAASCISSATPGGTCGTSFATSTSITHDTVVVDTHSAYNTTTGVYTIPEDGVYHIHGQYNIKSNSSAGYSVAVGLAVDSTEVRNTFFRIVATINNNYVVPYSFLVSLTAGQQVTMRGWINSGTAPGLNNAPKTNCFQIHKV